MTYMIKTIIVDDTELTHQIITKIIKNRNIY